MAEYDLIDVIAIKQLYARHYFQAALEPYFCFLGLQAVFISLLGKGQSRTD
jgi:hypothetical protein